MSTFIVYPAIDLHAGKVVRLMQGDLSRETIYGDDPSEFVRRWFAAGAEWIHLVNLDGAFENQEAANLAALKGIMRVQQSEFPDRKIQLGGGIRTLDMAKSVLQMRIARVILGTLAASQPSMVEQAVNQFGAEQVAVALDVKDGQICIRGWVESTPYTLEEFASKMAFAGVRTLIYTDVARDGTSAGTNLEKACHLAEETGVEIILSGGVATLRDIQAARSAGLAGVITGRALYQGAFSLQEALSVR